jgi:hypothetical protein
MSENSEGPNQKGPANLTVRMVQHAVAAGAFFFVLQYFVLDKLVHVAVLWAAFFAAAAALLAWHQSRR